MNLTVEQISQLPCLVPPMVIPESFEDANGHVNIRHYLDLGSNAITALLEDCGVTDDYRSGRGMGLFTAENHLRYHAEMLVGQQVAAYGHLLRRSHIAVHSMAYVVNVSEQRLAGTFESLVVHVDMRRRRALSMPTDLIAAIDRTIAAGAVEWPPPVCGSIRIRD